MGMSEVYRNYLKELGLLVKVNIQNLDPGLLCLPSGRFAFDVASLSWTHGHSSYAKTDIIEYITFKTTCAWYDEHPDALFCITWPPRFTELNRISLWLLETIREIREETFELFGLTSEPVDAKHVENGRQLQVIETLLDHINTIIWQIEYYLLLGTISIGDTEFTWSNCQWKFEKDTVYFRI